MGTYIPVPATSPLGLNAGDCIGLSVLTFAPLAPKKTQKSKMSIGDFLTDQCMQRMSVEDERLSNNDVQR